LPVKVVGCLKRVMDMRLPFPDQVLGLSGMRIVDC